MTTGSNELYRRCGGRSCAKPDSGFVLVSVLWILVIMTLAAGAFSLWVDRTRELAEQKHLQVESRHKGASLIAQVVYTYLVGKQGVEGVAWPSEYPSAAAGTNAVGFASLEEFLSGTLPQIESSTPAGLLKLDGSVLDVGHGMRMIVQDRAGLVGLSGLNSPRVFEVMVAGAKRLEPARLRAALIDYQDEDDYRLPNGAERGQYTQAGMAPPMNGQFRNPLQLRSVWGWADALQPYSDAWILRTFKVEGGGAINVNTAPASALTLTAPEGAAIPQLLEQRQHGPYRSIFDLSAIGLGRGEEIPFSITPAAGIRVWWWRDGDSIAQVCDIQFRPLSPGKLAWYVSWTTRVELSDELAAQTATKIDHSFFH